MTPPTPSTEESGQAPARLTVPDTLVDDAVAAIIQAARTGEIGDGRVFVMPVEASYRIRTGEQGEM